jgi:Zn-dependent M28 family amino/carboxypeptidase
MLHFLVPIISAVWLLLIFAIKNPHNHNDNTSGCIGVYNVATIVAEDVALRAKCAFVLFDREELGLLGSSAFAKWRKKTYPGRENSCVINLDCIGVGEYLILASKSNTESKKERAAMAKHFQAAGFETFEKTSSLFGYLSDHAMFEKGVMLAFLKRSRLGGLYIPNIHTSKDTVCSLEQIARLSESVVKYVRDACA